MIKCDAAFQITLVHSFVSLSSWSFLPYPSCDKPLHNDVTWPHKDEERVEVLPPLPTPASAHVRNGGISENSECPNKFEFDETESAVESSRMSRSVLWTSKDVIKRFALVVRAERMWRKTKKNGRVKGECDNSNEKLNHLEYDWMKRDVWGGLKRGRGEYALAVQLRQR
jgi:hypothetical protein